MPTLVSIQVGLPKTHEVAGKPWRTGYFKHPVDGPVHVAFENLAGDGQGSRQIHGGLDRAVLAYAAEHYPLWRQERPELALPFGAFGENLTVSGLDERTVCVGDRHHLGDVMLEVTMPRDPCKNISRANGDDTLFEAVQATGRIGWLYRVIREGTIAPGQALVVEPGPNPTWTVERTMDVYKRVRKPDDATREAARELAKVEALAVAWRERFAKAAGAPV